MGQVPENHTHDANHDSNRSAALSPESIAAINTATTSAVTEALKALIPIMASMALTPDKIQQLKAPYVDPAVKKRNEREALKSKEDEAEAIRQMALFRKNCTHHYKNNLSAIYTVHNQPDHQPRGVCVLCHDWIHPREWRIGPPDDKNPRGRAYLVEAHKDYAQVLYLESQLMSGNA